MLGKNLKIGLLRLIWWGIFFFQKKVKKKLGRLRRPYGFFSEKVFFFGGPIFFFSEKGIFFRRPYGGPMHFFFQKKVIFFLGRLRRPYGMQLLNLGQCKILSCQMLVPPNWAQKVVDCSGTDEGVQPPTGRSFLNR